MVTQSFLLSDLRDEGIEKAEICNVLWYETRLREIEKPYPCRIVSRRIHMVAATNCFSIKGWRSIMQMIIHCEEIVR